jgi:hypothetical protein
MLGRVELDILPQPDESTCGPTCLHAVYRAYGDVVDLAQLCDRIERLDNGGTLAAILAADALKRGYKATLYSYNLQVFDPTWFELAPQSMIKKLERQARLKKKPRLITAIRSYVRFLELGGRLAFDDLTPELLERYLSKGTPILTGLSATYLYRSVRERGRRHSVDDDVRGKPAGHFVVLCGYDPGTRRVLVADPLEPNPYFEAPKYEIDVQRVICAILLGILTYDSVLAVIEPGPHSPVPAPPANGTRA